MLEAKIIDRGRVPEIAGTRIASPEEIRVVGHLAKSSGRSGRHFSSPAASRSAWRWAKPSERQWVG